MNQRTRLISLVLIALALAGMLVLAESLASLQFSPGRAFSIDTSSLVSFFASIHLPGGQWIVLFVRVFIAIGLLLFPFYILYHLFSREGRRRLLVDLILLGMIVFGLALLARRPMQPLEMEPGDASGSLRGVFDNLPGGTEVQIFTHPPEWLVVLVGIILAMIVALIGAVLVRAWMSNRRDATSPLKRIALKAEEAMVALSDGGDVQAIIIRCYTQMSRVLAEERGWKREIAMTPREFEQQLTGYGLPVQPVQVLTRLFEDVRYGRNSVGKAEEDRAVESLTAIIHFARRSSSTIHEGQG